LIDRSHSSWHWQPFCVHQAHLWLVMNICVFKFRHQLEFSHVSNLLRFLFKFIIHFSNERFRIKYFYLKDNSKWPFMINLDQQDENECFNNAVISISNQETIRLPIFYYLLSSSNLLFKFERA
jgi:hypothetical protein